MPININNYTLPCGEVSHTTPAQTSNAIGQTSNAFGTAYNPYTVTNNDVIAVTRNYNYMSTTDLNQSFLNRVAEVSINHMDVVNDVEESKKRISFLEEEIKELRKICARTNTALNNIIAKIQVEEFNKENNKCARL